MKINSSSLAIVALMSVSVACSSYKYTEKTMADANTPDSDEHVVARSIAQSQGDGESFNRITEGKMIQLKRCGGTAKLTRLSGQLTLQIRGSNCSNVKTSKGIFKMDGQGSTDRFANVHIDENAPGDRMVLVGSNAYIQSNGNDGNGDYITVKVPAKRLTLNLRNTSQTATINLNHCNGSIRASVSQGRVNVVVYNTGCSKFDIVSNDGTSVSYDVKSIPEVSHEAGYSGSFTIPNRFYDRGANGIVIRLFAPRLTEEQVLVKFNAF